MICSPKHKGFNEGDIIILHIIPQQKNTLFRLAA